jgi:hypothetical protein
MSAARMHDAAGADIEFGPHALLFAAVPVRCGERIRRCSRQRQKKRKARAQANVCCTRYSREPEATNVKNVA